MNERKYKFIDLFAGAGGLSEGFVSEGSFMPVAHVEMSKYAAETLKTRSCYYYLLENNKKKIYRDYLRGKISRDQLYSSVPEGLLNTVINSEISSSSIQEIFTVIDNEIKEHELGEIDLIIGGPPCQAYSLMGRAVDPKGMKGDPRNYLYKLYIDFLRHYNPKAFVFENVPGILTANNGKIFKNIISTFRKAGYTVEYNVLDAKDFGVLQQRKRVIIFGWKTNLSFKYPQPDIVEMKTTVFSILNDLAPLTPGETNNTYRGNASLYLKETGIRKKNDILTLHECRPHNDTDLQIYRNVITAWNNGHNRLLYYDLPEVLKTRENESSFVDRYKVVAGDKQYAHTMIAHIAKDGHYFIHPDIQQCRSISVREAARIQSFPDDFYFEGPRTAKFTQIGNAVPPLMAKAIAKKISEMFNEGEKSNES